MVVGDFPIETETLVIGAGPGGYVAAIRAAQLGQKVTIVEKERLGGVCLNVGCIPSKALITATERFYDFQHSGEMGIIADNVRIDFLKLQEWKNRIVQKLTSGVESLLKGNKVDIVYGQAFFVDEHTLRVIEEKNAQTYKFNNCIIATGSRPVELKALPFSERVLDSTGALNLQEIPETLVVVGGGYIGIELAGVFSNLGCKVTVLEGEKQILPGFEKQMSQLVMRRLKKKGVEIHTEAFAKKVEETAMSVKITAEIKGKEEVFEADYCLVSVGRRPNTDEIGLEATGVETDERGFICIDEQCRTNIPHIFAIGDVVAGPMLAHKASYEGKIAAEAIAGKKSAIDYLAIPAIVFSSPELSSVGYTEQKAKEEGIDVIVSKFPFAANGRALALNETDGFVKLIARKSDGVIIGGQIAGGNASDLIAEIGLAIEANMTLEDIALTIHAHPTLAEMMMEAAEIALGTPIHILK